MEFNNVILENTSAFGRITSYTGEECINLCVKYAKNFYVNELRNYFIFMFIVNIIFFLLIKFSDKIPENYKKFIDYKYMILFNALFFGSCIFLIEYESY